MSDQHHPDHLHRTETAPRRSRLVVLAGPTAVGKGTVAAAVRDSHPDVWISVSATTRAPRPGEVDGVHYHFVSDERFDQMVADDDLLEWAVVHRAARYGTPRGPVEEALRAGRPSMLEIDLQGARQVRRTMPDALFVFLKPPSWEELVRRLCTARRLRLGGSLVLAAPRLGRPLPRPTAPDHRSTLSLGVSEPGWVGCGAQCAAQPATVPGHALRPQHCIAPLIARQPRHAAA